MMRTLMVLAVLALAVKNTAAEEIAWIIPDGIGAEEVAALLSDSDSLPQIEGAEQWGAVLRGRESVISARDGRLGIEVDPPAGASLAVLDALVQHCCRRIRAEKLETLPALTEAERLGMEQAAREVEAARLRMRDLLASGEGVVDREAAIADSAGRTEDLRRRVVDARIELAVVQALGRVVKSQADGRRQELEHRRQTIVLAMEKAVEKDLARSMYLPGGEIHESRLQAIREVRDQTFDDDERLNEFLSRLADLEAETIGLEERVKALTEALQAEGERSLRILDAVDLSQFQATNVAPAEARLLEQSQKHAALKRDLESLRMDKPARRVDSGRAGELPRVHALGAVRNPGEYLFEGGRMTLTKLIALVGDFRPRADPSAIKILRRDGGGRTWAFVVDLDRIIAGEIPDLVLCPDDIVYVPEAQ